jgi:hypothetical protein
MTVFRNYGLIFMVVFLAGCTGISVQEDYNPQTDFTVLKTYDWAKVEKNSGMNDLDMARVKVAVNGQMKKKGYIQRPGNPDFLVTAHVAVKRAGKVAGTNVSINSDTVSLTGRTGTGNTDTGTLTLDFSDPKSNALLWQGSAKGALKDLKTPEKRAERINAAVARILDQFPPGR